MIKKTLAIIFSLFLQVYAQYQPEFYTKIKDFDGGNYTIRATSLTDIYDYNGYQTDQFSVAVEQYYAPPDAYYPGPVGFEYVMDRTANGETWDIIAYSTYLISFLKEGSKTPFWTITIDFKQCYPYKDVTLKLHRDQFGIISRIIESYRWDEQQEEFVRYTMEVNDHEFFNYWDLLNVEYFDDCFRSDIIVRNILDQNDYGELFVNDQEILSGESINLHKSSSNEFRTYESIIEDSYLFRNWERSENKYSNPKNMIIDDENDVVAFLFPTHPLTVHNYLEGGSGGSYKVLWEALGSWSEWIGSNENYYAFDSLKTNDKYDITINQTIPSEYGTNWEFQYWDNGSTSLTRSNIAVSEPTTLKAYYKGVDKTDAANALINNNQAKIIRAGTSSTGTLFKVYESMDCVWLEKSTNNGVSWELMNDGKPHQHFL